MIIEQEKKEKYDWFMEKYMLNKMHRSLLYKKRGLIICYLMVTSSEIELIRLKIEIDKELGALEDNEDRYNNKNFIKKFASFEEFYKEYDREDFSSWGIEFICKNEEFHIGGVDYSNEVGVSFLKTCTVDIKPLLEEIEEKSYLYNGFDDELIKAIQDKENCSYIEVVKKIEVVAFDKDIWEEFKSVLINGTLKTGEKAIAECGITAQRIMQKKNISLSEAYEILYEIRHDAKKGLERLKSI